MDRDAGSLGQITRSAWRRAPAPQR